jgi:Holliday junction resolvase
MRPKRCASNDLKAQGWTVCRRGWPDFLAVRDGRVIAVEVKPNSDRSFKQEQLFVLQWLALAGLEIYTWTPDDASPVRWVP